MAKRIEEVGEVWVVATEERAAAVTEMVVAAKAVEMERAAVVMVKGAVGAEGDMQP